MVTILDMPEVRRRVSRLSVEEYHRLNEFNENRRRTELIRGIVIEKMSKSPLHAAVAKRLYDRLARVLGAGWVVRREDPLTLGDSEPEPDIAVVAGAEADFLRAHPTTAALVIEVAVSSPALDRENARLYAEAGVTEYWIVLAAERRVEVYVGPARERHLDVRVLDVQATLASASVPGLELRVRDPFP